VFALLEDYAGMKRRLTLTLDEFGRSALEAEARRHALETQEFVQRAAEYFLAESDPGRTAHRVPRFQREETGDAKLALVLELQRDVWDELEAEAASQGVSLERLLGYAALYLVADLDSGRVAKRVLEDEPLASRRQPKRRR
jgi:hypothetical protein